MISYLRGNLMLAAPGTSSGSLGKLATLDLLLRAPDAGSSWHGVRFLMVY